MQNVYMGLDVEDFIFSEGTTYGDETYNNVTDEEMNAFGVIECTEDPDVACYKIALENEQNHNAIMMAMLTHEYNVLESTGEVMVYEGGAIKSFLNKVKEQIQKFWAKVKGVFKRVTDQLSSIVMSNKTFVKKYRSAGNLEAPAKDFTGYNFDTTKFVVPYSAAVSEIGEIKQTDTSDNVMETKLNLVRSRLCFNQKVTADNFAEVLKDQIYGSKNTVVVSTSGKNFQNLLDNLENASREKKAAKDAYKEAEKSVKKMLDDVKKLQREAESGSAEEKAAKTRATAISRCLGIMSTALSVQTRAIIASAVQDRKMANYFVNSQNVKKKDEKKSVNASAIMDLDSLELI